MRDGPRIQAVIELLSEYKQHNASRGKPIDAIVASYYRTRRYIGAKDRAYITDLFYFSIRHLRSLAWAAGQDCFNFEERKLVISALCFQKTHKAAAISALFDGSHHAPAPLKNDETQLFSYWKAHKSADVPEAVQADLPDWALPLLQESFGDDWANAAKGLNQQAPIDLRVNSLKCKDIHALRGRLAAQGIMAEFVPNMQGSLRVAERFAAHATEAFKEGQYEMQDAGSQFLALCVPAKPSQKMIDFCAGAGGKTLAIAAQMNNKGRIFALDIAENRLKQLRPRLARAGVDNVMTRLLESENDPWLKRHKESADWVLIDAPCSGSGTWRRNPDLKWRFDPTDLEEICALQARILDAAAKLVKPGGGLIYATCSVYRAENHAQVAAFTERNPRFRLAAPAKIWDKQASNYLSSDGLTQFSPHKDGMDGFFVAQLMHGSTA